jgi:outer membrane protein OmpA-like peptidoglycan-associated protein
VSDLVRHFARYFLGADIFVCYPRSDASRFAGALAARLSARGLRVFIDQAGAPPGVQVPKTVLRAANRAMVMVVLESPAARDSEAMAQEIAAFPYETRPVIIVSFTTEPTGDRLYPWGTKLSGLYREIEPREVLTDGAPPAALLERIDIAVGNQRQRDRIRRAGLAGVALFSCAGIAFLATLVMLHNAQRQLSATLQHDRTLSEQVDREGAKLSQLQNLTADQERLLKDAASRAAKAQAREKALRSVTQSVWETAQSGIQSAYSQPDLSCNGNALSMDPPLTIFFEVDRSSITDSAKHYLKQLAECWLRVGSRPKLLITGHVEIGAEDVSGAASPKGYSEEYAFALGDREAEAVKQALIADGVPSERISIMSYGKDKPRFQTPLWNNRAEITLSDVK